MDGNRDWWFVLNGNYVPTDDTVPWWVVLIFGLLGVGIGGVAIVIRKKR